MSSFAATYAMFQLTEAAGKSERTNRMFFTTAHKRRIVIQYYSKLKCMDISIKGEESFPLITVDEKGVPHWRKSAAFVLGESDSEIRNDLRDLINSIMDDPVQAAKTSAARSGVCSFCGRELTDQRSKEVGYGPVCAETNQLPWGDFKPVDLETLF